MCASKFRVYKVMDSVRIGHASKWITPASNQNEPEAHEAWSSSSANLLLPYASPVAFSDQEEDHYEYQVCTRPCSSSNGVTRHTRDPDSVKSINYRVRKALRSPCCCREHYCSEVKASYVIYSALFYSYNFQSNCPLGARLKPLWSYNDH